MSDLDPRMPVLPATCPWCGVDLKTPTVSRSNGRHYQQCRHGHEWHHCLQHQTRIVAGEVPVVASLCTCRRGHTYKLELVLIEGA